MRRSDNSSSLLQEYGRLAAGYDTRWAFYVDASIRETLARLEVHDGDRLLDIGCGTGVLLDRLARSNPSLQLTGIDPVPAMLDKARRRLPQTTTLLQAWAQSLPLADATIDRAVSCSMLHYLAQPGPALAELHRVLVPGGTLVITDWCRDFLTVRLLDAYLRLSNGAHQRTLSRDELCRLLSDNGFRPVRQDRYRINRFWGLMTVVAVRE